ncbi:hypothetical protein HMPREF0185_00491 [Brevundimonas diminuta 470-4]|nr:hypothetical protein HMPREF0185_00491 [Brevundimonas diminuta 470-4]
MSGRLRPSTATRWQGFGAAWAPIAAQSADTQGAGPQPIACGDHPWCGD